MKTVLASCALLLTLSRAWSINGHLYTAAIAERVLQARSPVAWNETLALLQVLKDADPDMTYREVNHAFVESSTFADDWKYRGESWQGPYHYVNIPWITEGDEGDYTIKSNEKNLTAGCTQIIEWLSHKHGRGFMNTYMYERIMSDYDDNGPVAESWALRILIHIMGDLSQPLHSMMRYNSDYPQGDKGATSFKLKYRYGVSHLHALWDKVLYEERNNIARPIADDDWTDIQEMVDTLVRDYGKIMTGDAALDREFSIQEWTEEAWEIATGLYDAGITENQKVPQEYIDEHLNLAYQQILVGGYRLAAVLEYIFDPDTDLKFTQ